MASRVFEVRITMYPDVPAAQGGGFKSATFDHLLQSQIELEGLDNRWTHTLIGAAVADDGESAELHIHSEPKAARNLTRAFRILNGTPPAAVRAVSPTGEVLVEARLPAPLQAGQRIQIGDDEYSVVRTDWPHRDRETGVCTGQLDWQHAEVHPAPPPATIPVQAPQVLDPRRAVARTGPPRRVLAR